MNFFEAEQLARRTTRVLVLLYLLAVAAVAGAVCLGLGIAYTVGVVYGAVRPARQVVIDGDHLGAALLDILLHGVPHGVYGWGAGITLLLILGATAYKMTQLAGGGAAVADMVGARMINAGSAPPEERRLLNVVEEMAIASGVSVPPVFVMDQETGINAFAAGYSPHEAVIVVTQGTLQTLSRDELQGVIGHEFSHILNGDMRLNVRLLGVLFGIVCIAQLGQFLIRSTARSMASVSRENRGPGVMLVIAGIALALIGFMGLELARLIKAAISRQREFLADASSVQFTRNPDGIAGALDTISASQRSTLVHDVHAEELSHMFFVQGVANWMGSLFDTHPPIEERIRRVRPGFQRTRYRAQRDADRASPVAVLDGAGNLVKTITVAASVGNPTPEHVDYARRLLAQIPATLRARLAGAEGAEQVIFALATAGDDASRRAKLEALRARRGEATAAAVQAASDEMRGAGLGRAHALPLVGIALPVLKGLKQGERDALIEDVAKVVAADGKVTLGEFVLAAIVRQRLREGAGGPLPSKYQSVAEVDANARVVLSLVAHAAAGDTAAAYARGAEILGLNLRDPLPTAELSMAAVGASLERLRLLAPLAKPRMLKACLDAASADGALTLAEAELVRLVAATLDCPLPPVLAELDPTTLK